MAFLENIMKVCVIALICISQTNAAKFKWKLCCTLNGPFVDERDAIDTCKTASWLYYPQNATGETFACPAGTNAVYPYFQIQYNDSTSHFNIKSLKHKKIAYVDLDTVYEIQNIDIAHYEITVQKVSYGSYLGYNYRESTSYIYIEPIVNKIYSDTSDTSNIKILAGILYAAAAFAWIQIPGRAPNRL